MDWIATPDWLLRADTPSVARAWPRVVRRPTETGRAMTYTADLLKQVVLVEQPDWKPANI